MACALQWLQERDAHELALAVSSKDQLSGMLAEVLGADAVRSLDRDNAYVRKGITLYLLTPKSQRRRMQGPVVAFGLEPDQLEDVISAQGVTDVIYVRAERVGPRRHCSLSVVLSAIRGAGAARRAGLGPGRPAACSRQRKIVGSTGNPRMKARYAAAEPMSLNCATVSSRRRTAQGRRSSPLGAMARSTTR